jgi:hypothetical protein
MRAMTRLCFARWRDIWKETEIYAKLFSSIYQGTLRGDAHGLLVFTNLLAHADKTGIVDIHPRAIADEVGLPEPDVRIALLRLEAPDEESRTPDEDGRRIIRTDAHRVWGWRIVNHAKYRAIRNEDDRREQNRLAQERWRNKNKPKSAEESHGDPEKAQSETDAKSDAKSETKKKRAPAAPTLTVDDLIASGLSQEVAEGFLAHRKTKKAPLTALAWKGFVSEVEKATGWTLEAAALKAIARNWISVEAAWLLGSGGTSSGTGHMNRQKAVEDSNRAVGRAWASKGADHAGQ